GGLRPGDDKWADSVVALRAKTGEIAWGFQLVHHTLWDYDTASPPLLATLPHNGQKIPVVIQSNKTGFIYVLNRDTGTPVFPVEERPVPQSDVPGEVTSPTQPIPVAPPPVTPQKLSPDDALGSYSFRPRDLPEADGWHGQQPNLYSARPARHRGLAGSYWRRELERLCLRSAKKPAVLEYEQLSFPSEANPFRESHARSHERRRVIRQSAGSALRRVPCSVLFAELRAVQSSAVGDIDCRRYGGRQDSLAGAARLDAELRRCAHYTGSARLV